MSTSWENPEPEGSNFTLPRAPRIFEHQFSRWPHGLELKLAAVKGLTTRDYKAFIACVNLTYGYNVEEKEISPEQLSAMTGIPKNHVSTSLQNLHRLGFIVRTRTSVKIIPVGYEEWKEHWEREKTAAIERRKQKVIAKASVPYEETPEIGSTEDLPCHYTHGDIADNFSPIHPIREIWYSTDQELWGCGFLSD